MALEVPMFLMTFLQVLIWLWTMARGRGLGFAEEVIPETVGRFIPRETNPKVRNTRIIETDIFRNKKLCNRTPWAVYFTINFYLYVNLTIGASFFL
jgi:hypothetical protein